LDYHLSALNGLMYAPIVLLNFNREQAFHIEIYKYLEQVMNRNKEKYPLTELFTTEDGIKHLTRDLNAPRNEL
jgi:ABC-type histidine transport system ATPase subunit